MALTRKHFEMVARNIAAEVTTVDQNSFNIDQQNAVLVSMRNLAINLCTEFRAENPNFDATRFLKACGFPRT